MKILLTKISARIQALKKSIVRAYYRNKVLKEVSYEKRPCPICGNENKFEVLYTTDRYNLPVSTKRCIVCQLVLQQPAPTEEFLKKFYSSRMYRGLYLGVLGPDRERGNDGGLKKAQINKAFIAKNVPLPKDAGVLDFGSADGATILELKEGHPTWSVYGLEPGRSFASTSKDKLDGFYSHIQDIPASMKFDLIMMSHVLEHLPYPVKILTQLAQHLNEKGIFMIEVPDFGQYDNTMLPIHIAHLYHFTRETITKLAEKAGLAPILINNEDRIDARYGMRVVLSKK